MRAIYITLACSCSVAVPATAADEPKPAALSSAKSGPWSDPATWAGGKIPAAGAVVYVRPADTVVYDVKSSDVIRSIHLDGTLRFADDRDTLLEVGLIRVGAGGTTDEEGFDCNHRPAADRTAAAALLVGTPERPIDAGKTAVIRLHALPGMDPKSCPAVVCCGGRMEFHGAAMSRTWVKLGAAAKAGDTAVSLAEPVAGWRVGDRVILTATTRQNKVKKTFRESTKDATQTEERTIKAIAGDKVTLDRPLAFDHRVEGDYRGEVANLSRNVVVESAEAAKGRGHTMYHRHSSGSIAYAEFRHLGKEGVLGRYSLHYHLCGDTMRGSSVIGASIWDSGNRWVTIHGTDYLVVRDCVGYRSAGHGFFLEDGTEVYNVLDRNLAVQAYIARPLPEQVLPFDKNDGSGFWWANSHNSFTRNVAAECDEYGYFFQATKTATFDPVLSVRKPDGSRAKTDIRTLPFVRFEDNETHTQRRHGFNLGGGVPFGPPNVGGVGPDPRHPFVVRNFRMWDVHWAIHPVSPSVLLQDLAFHDAEYGIWRPEYKAHAYTGLKFSQVPDDLRYAFVAGNRPPNPDTEFPKPLDPVDDSPPATVITHVENPSPGKLVVRGTTSDDGTVATVWVNGKEARGVVPNFAEWQVVLEGVPAGAVKLTAHAKDRAGNEEVTKHERSVVVR
jgi:hypothetical protein